MGGERNGSGVNDTRPRTAEAAHSAQCQRNRRGHKDRLTRFGINSLEQLLKMQDHRIEGIDLAGNGKEDLIQDFVSIVTSFCARLYGQRRSRRMTERLIAEFTQSPLLSVSSLGE